MTIRELLRREVEDRAGDRYDDERIVRNVHNAVRGVLFHAGVEEEELIQRITDAVQQAVLEIDVYDCYRLQP